MVKKRGLFNKSYFVMEKYSNIRIHIYREKVYLLYFFNDTLACGLDLKYLI